MNRTKRIENILVKYFDEHTIIVKDNSYLHKGHNNFDGNEETHFSIILNSNKKNRESKLEIHRKIESWIKKNPTNWFLQHNRFN